MTETPTPTPIPTSLEHILQYLDTVLTARKKAIKKAIKMDNHSDEVQASNLHNNTESELKPSYVGGLYQKGEDAILKKVIEEAGEVLMASKDHTYLNSDQTQTALINEVADVWFHTLILLHHHNCSSSDVLQALASRQGVGGIVEKMQRDHKSTK